LTIPEFNQPENVEPIFTSVPCHIFNLAIGIKRIKIQNLDKQFIDKLSKEINENPSIVQKNSFILNVNWYNIIKLIFLQERYSNANSGGSQHAKIFKES
jgi:uncharacterized Fe-S cluster-containing MiaB family protein